MAANRPVLPQPVPTATQSLLQPQYTTRTGLKFPALGRPQQSGQKASTLSTVGTGVPSKVTPGFLTAGSIWIRTDGSPGARLYTSTGTQWVAVPGF